MRIVFNGADHHKAIISTWNVIDYIATKNTEKYMKLLLGKMPFVAISKQAHGNICMACTTFAVALFLSG